MKETTNLIKYINVPEDSSRYFMTGTEMTSLWERMRSSEEHPQPTPSTPEVAVAPSTPEVTVAPSTPEVAVASQQPPSSPIALSSDDLIALLKELNDAMISVPTNRNGNEKFFIIYYFTSTSLE